MSTMIDLVTLPWMNNRPKKGTRSLNRGKKGRQNRRCTMDVYMGPEEVEGKDNKPFSIERGAFQEEAARTPSSKWQISLIGATGRTCARVYPCTGERSTVPSVIVSGSYRSHSPKAKQERR
ncbi:hypothetical protein KM043_017024 [Ampulex compressa]|nr:hypothetical protein KM043_017024 [Ampulex compressa]